MRRREFLGLTVSGSLAAATAGISPSKTATAGEEKYRVVEEGREISSSCPPIAIALHAELPLPKNGRQLARRRDGLWFFTYASHTHMVADGGRRSPVGRQGYYTSDTEIRMRASRVAVPSSTADFGPEDVLVRKAAGYTGPTPRSVGYVIAGEGAGDVGTNPSMVIDSQDVLHLIWVRPRVGEIWYAHCDVSGPAGTEAIRRTEAWRHADDERIGAERIGENDADLDDICLDAQGRPCVVYRHRNGVSFARYDNGWQRKIIAEGQGLKWPIMACDRTGTLHVVWCDGQGLLYYLRSEDGGVHWGRADGKTSGPDFIGGYCTEAPSLAVAGKEIVVAHYQRFKVITFSHYDGRRWRENTVVRQSYNHNSPMLTVDQHEVIWMHMVYHPYNWSQTCRWLGDRWSDLQEGRRLDNLVTCSAERVMSADAQEFGVILADKSHRLFFDSFTVPAPTTVKGQHVMFLDLWEISRLEGVEQVVTPMEKDPANPVLKHGKPGSWDAAQANFQGTILKEGERYRLWYTGLDVKPYFPHKAACGYAESTDGVNWTKPDLGLYPFAGSKHNNICFPYGFQYAILRMPEELEPDPAKRYRMAFNTGRGTSLAFSPDGIRWTPSKENPLWTQGRPGDVDQNIAENGVYIYDPLDPDPERRFKAYPQTVGPDGIRTISLMTSPDGIRFKRYANNPIVDPNIGLEKQNHLMEVCWQRHGVFIGLYGCYLDNINVDARLATSRDGAHWVRVKNEVPFLHTGEPGSWDAGMVMPSNYPIVDGEYVWIYYSGFEFNFSSGEGHASVGRARVRLDGFAKMQLQPGKSIGTLTTIPFKAQDLDKVSLVVNADNLAPGKRYLRVEVLDAATGEPLPGLSAENCNPLIRDGIAIPVTWRNRHSLRDIRAERIRFRFIFSGSDSSPRLYSFGFE